MTKAKLLENLAVRKLKLLVRMNRFKNWQKRLEGKKTFTEQDGKRSLSYWRKERRLNNRIEYIDNQIREIAYNSDKILFF